MALFKFGWLPGHWGLVGKTREIAKAEYELTGIYLKKKLLEIRKDEMTDDDYRTAFWRIQLEAGEISENDYNRNLASLIKDDKMRDIAITELDFKEGKISEVECKKKIATSLGEPWVTVLNMDVTKGNSLEGSFELDWNEHFVEKLKTEGYQGADNEAIVNLWFMELCKNVALEEFDGTGDFTADANANLEAMKRWSSSEPVDQDRRGYS